MRLPSQMQTNWNNITIKQNEDGQIVAVYENDEVILEVTEGTMAPAPETGECKPPSPYFLSVRHLWLDGDKKSTDDWNKAEFLFDAGEYVRINKGKTWKEIIDDVDREFGFE